jgi:MFS family permease
VLTQAGSIIGAYGPTWGVSQWFTGRLSDRIGRHRPTVWGMWLSGLDVAALVMGRGAVCGLCRPP